MANRFNQLIDYPEHVSSYVPLPLERIAAVGAMKQDLYDKAMAEYLDASKEIIGGNVTKDQAKFLNDRKDKDLSAMVDEAAKTDNYNQLKYQVKSYAEKLKSDPLYQGIEEDKKLSDAANKTILEQGSHVYVQDYWDPTANKYNQLDVSTPFTAGVYKTIKPGDPQKEFKPYYDQLHDIIKQTYGNDIQEQVNSDGSISLIQNGTKVVRSISRDELKTLARGLSKIDPNFNALDSFTYAEALNNKTNPNKKWSSEDNLDIFVDNYLGNKYEESELQKVIGTRKAAGDGLGKGNESANTDGHVRLIQHLDNMHNSPDSSSVSNTADMAAWNNGRDNKDGTVSINTTNTPIYLQIGKTSNDAVGAEDQIKLNKAIDLKGRLNQVVDKNTKIIDTLPDNLSDASYKEYRQYNSSNPNDFKTYYKRKGYAVVIEEDNLTGKKKELSYETFHETPYFKEHIAAINAHDEDYKKINSAANKENIDLNDPSLTTRIDKVSKNDIIRDFTIGIKNLSGEVKIVPSSGKNTFEDSEGDVITKNDAVFTKSQLAQVFGQDSWFWDSGYKKLETAGLIKATGKLDDKGDMIYSVPIYTKVNQDVGTMTEAMQRYNYSGEDGNLPEYLFKNLNQDITKANTTAARYKTEKQISSFNKAFNAAPDKFKLNWNLSLNDATSDIKNVMEARGDSKESIDNFLSVINTRKKEITDMPEKTEEQKHAKSTEMYKLKLFITDPDKYDLIYPQNTSNQGGVSPQGQNSNPLGI